MIGVVIPAHDEEHVMAACLDHVAVAARSPRLKGEAVRVVVVLDACTDQTGAIARRHGATVLSVEARNVGVARAAGAQFCLDLGCRWLAFTDADTHVAEAWLVQQMLLGSDAVCGTVAVRDWGDHGIEVRDHFARNYTDADGHRHIHGANLGVTAEAYQRAGGFPPIETSEDVALVRALERVGATIAWSARPRVWTSARKSFRAPGGFGQTLLRYEAEAAAPAGTAC
jgi:glycosyltransferase involved in cell wall biosynthesis